MSQTGPIILIDDDHDDKEIFEMVIMDLGISNKLIHFERCADVTEYLLSTREQPFIIFCDVNMPVCNGLEFKASIDADPVLRKKSIPFIFYSTSIDQRAVDQAYMEMSIQGFFQKKSGLEDIRKTVKQIIAYWLLCRHPNSDT